MASASAELTFNFFNFIKLKPPLAACDSSVGQGGCREAECWAYLTPAFFLIGAESHRHAHPCRVPHLARSVLPEAGRRLSKFGAHAVFMLSSSPAFVSNEAGALSSECCSFVSLVLFSAWSGGGVIFGLLGDPNRTNNFYLLYYFIPA